MNPARRFPSRRVRTLGATLIELLVAVILLTLGLLPLLLALNKIYVYSFSMGTRAEAQLLAAEKLDELKEAGFLTIETDYIAGADSCVITEDTLVARTFYRVTKISYQKFTDNTTLVEASGADVPTDYLKIKSAVSWSQDTVVMVRTATALIAREGSFE